MYNKELGIKKVIYGKSLEDPIIFEMTKKGMDRIKRIEEKQKREAKKRRGGGIPVSWLLWDDPITQAFISAHK